MSATGFQRRRRELAAAAAKAKPEAEQPDDYTVNNDPGLDAGEKTGIDTSADSGIAALKKAELIRFAEQQNIFDESFKALKKDELLQKIFETVRGKIIEAGWKTAEEASALPEKELFDLFYAIGK